MRTIALAAAFLGVAMATMATPSARAVTLTGTYVEVRTAEVFAGGCVINSEAGTTGREALLAWKVDRGRFNGVPLDGLAVAAAVSADANLGVHEIGGEVANTRTALFPDARATAAQRKALVAMARTLSNGIVGTVVEVTPASIDFVAGDRDIRVVTKTLRLTVEKQLSHDTACGNKQWFGPLAAVHHAEMGMTAENAFNGASLGTKWSDPNKRSAFFGTFAY
jgi:hypothetical protein